MSAKINIRHLFLAFLASITVNLFDLYFSKFTLECNDGVAFGIELGLIGQLFIAVILLKLIYSTSPIFTFLLIGLSTGNIADRVINGCVNDYFNLLGLVFNINDVSIVFCCIIFIFILIVNANKNPNSTRTNQT